MFTTASSSRQKRSRKRGYVCVEHEEREVSTLQIISSCTKHSFRPCQSFRFATMVTSPQHSPSSSMNSLDLDNIKKQKGPSRSYKVPVMVLCAVLGYGICQLDLSAGTLTSMPEMRSFTTGSYFNNGNGNGFANSKKPIKQISILGERNSGTRWTWG